MQSSRQRKASEGQRSPTTKGTSISRCSQTNLSVSVLGDVLQLLTSQHLSCSASVSSGSDMGSMMQHLRGSCNIDEALSVVVTWETIQKETLQWMKGSNRALVMQSIDVVDQGDASG